MENQIVQNALNECLNQVLKLSIHQKIHQLKKHYKLKYSQQKIFNHKLRNNVNSFAKILYQYIIYRYYFNSRKLINQNQLFKPSRKLKQAYVQFYFYLYNLKNKEFIVQYTICLLCLMCPLIITSICKVQIKKINNLKVDQFCYLVLIYETLGLVVGVESYHLLKFKFVNQIQKQKQDIRQSSIQNHNNDICNMELLDEEKKCKSSKKKFERLEQKNSDCSIKSYQISSSLSNTYHINKNNLRSQAKIIMKPIYASKFYAHKSITIQQDQPNINHQQCKKEAFILISKITKNLKKDTQSWIQLLKQIKNVDISIQKSHHQLTNRHLNKYSQSQAQSLQIPKTQLPKFHRRTHKVSYEQIYDQSNYQNIKVIKNEKNFENFSKYTGKKNKQEFSKIKLKNLIKQKKQFLKKLQQKSQKFDFKTKQNDKYE